MALKVILIASSVQLLSVLGVARSQPKSNLLADLRTKDSLAGIITDQSTGSNDQTAGIGNILKQLFPGRIMGGEVEQISSDEFSKLFGSERRKLQIQDENGKDTGIQYDFIPHVESESVPESATYTFFLRTGEPRLFLFDPNLDDFRGRHLKKSHTKLKNSPRKPKVQNFYDADSVDKQKDEHEPDNESNFTQNVQNLNTLIEEDRQSKVPKLQKLTLMDISSLLDDSEEDEGENEIDVEFSINSTSKKANVTVEVEEEVSQSTKALETLKTTFEDMKKNDVVDLIKGKNREIDSAAINTNEENNKPANLENVDISNPNVDHSKDVTAPTFQETSQQSQELEFKNVDKGTNNSINKMPEIDHVKETIVEGTTKMILIDENIQEEDDTANEKEATAGDNKDTLQLEISNNKLREETMKKDDEHMVDLVIDNLKVLNGTLGSRKENKVSRGSWLKAIPFLAYWAANYISSSPRFAAVDSDENEKERELSISDNIERAIEEFNEEKSGEFHTNINDVSEDLVNRLLTGRTENIKDEKLEDSVENESIKGIDLDRNVETEENQNFDVLATKSNPCNCRHGGECIQASKTCHCSHGFTGIKCERPIRKALVVGGLRYLKIRPDSEIVGGLDDRRCSPPAFPMPIMAATGQTDRNIVVVCGGATNIGGKLRPTNRCHLWANSSSWSPPLFMSSSRAWSASVLTPASQMVVLGGLDHNNITLDSIEVIDIKNRKSIPIGLTLPSPLAGHCAVQLNSSHTFVAGGAITGLAGFGESANFSNQAWILSEAGWTAAGNLVQARSVHSCSTVVTRGGEVEVLVVGGIGLSSVGTRMVLDSVEIYNAPTGRWRKGDKLPYSVFGAGLLELAGQPLLIGGRYQEDGQLIESDDVFIYRDSWRLSLNKIRSPRDQAVTLAAPAGC